MGPPSWVPGAPEVSGNATCDPVNAPAGLAEVDIRPHHHDRLMLVVRPAPDDLSSFRRFETILRETVSGAQRMCALTSPRSGSL